MCSPVTTMAFKIEHLVGGVTQVKWQAQIKQFVEDERQDEPKSMDTFILDFFHPLTTYSVLCEFYVKEIKMKKRVYTSQVKLTWSVKSTKDEKHHKPCAISVIVDEGETMELNLAQGSWETAEFEIEKPGFVLSSQPGLAPISMGLLFMIKFVSFDEKSNFKNQTDMFVEQTNCDIKFCFEDNHQIGGHVDILTAKSPVFAAMFQIGMQEAKTGQVRVEDFEPDVFEELLYFIYAGRTRTPFTLSLAQSLYIATDKYDIGDLKEECSKFLLSSIKEDNVISMLIWAERCFVEEIKEKCIAFAAKKEQVVFLYDVGAWNELMKFHQELSLTVIQRVMENVSDSVNWFN